ncbi:MAG: radical SAM protein [Smithella sp.]
MKDLLLYTPLDDFASTQYEFVPLGLLYLSSYASAAGYSVDVVHGRTDDLKLGYKHYGISATSCQYSMAKHALDRIRELQPDAIVILGGHHLNSPQCVQECSKHGWDYLVIGEGETALREILAGKHIPGVVLGSPIQDLDRIPFPAYDKLDMSLYNYPLREGLRCINIVTSRGCPFKCIFCSSSRSSYRQRSAENIFAEIEMLISEYHFNAFTFLDDMMSINTKRYFSILSGLEEFDVKWKAHGRTTTITFEGLERMARAGCIECSPGIESGDQSLLNLICKGTNVKDNLNWCKVCEGVGIKCSPFIIIGLPNESFKTIEATRIFMEESKVTAFSYNILMPFPDSPLYLNYARYRQYITIHSYSWDDCIVKSKKMQKCFVSTPFLTKTQILDEYYKNYDLFASVTNYDPRRRGCRGG